MATFSVNDQVRRTVSDGDGSVSSFAFSFQINAVSDIKVYVDDELKTAGQHYNVVNSSNVAGLNADGTGKVNFITSPTNYTPAANTRVSVVSDVPIARTSVYSSGGNITAASLESDFDTLTMIAGDNEETLSRSVHGPVSDPTTTSMQLPAKDTRKNKYLAFDNNGSVTCLAGTLEPLNTIDTGQLVDDAVTTSKIANNAITSDLLATNAVQATNLAANSVTSSALQNDSVTQSAVANNAIGTDQIADGAVTADKLATGAAFVSGMVMPYAGTSAPTGWLLCDASSYSTVTHSALHAVISNTYGGTAYNAGVTDQSGQTTTFNVPDLRGRVVAGKGSGSNLTTPDQTTLGATGGDDTHTLTSAQLPAHTHDAGTLSTGLNFATSNGTNPVLSLNNVAGLTTTQAVSGNTGGVNGSHGGAHNNVQPTIILNYIIKT